MAREIPNVRRRGDAYFARIGVPKELRPIVGTAELQEKVGTTHREALNRSRIVLAGFQAKLDDARRQLAEANAGPLTVPEIARTHYEEELATDERVRDQFGADLTDMSWARPGYAALLRRVASGRATDAEIGAAIGWAVDKFAERGNVEVAEGSPGWRQLARTLAMVQLEALERVAERDQGDFTGKPKVAVLVEPAPTPAPVVVPFPATARGRARVTNEMSLQPLSDLLDLFHAERRVAPGTAAEHKVAVRMLDEFLGRSRPLCEIVPEDVTAFKNALIRTPANYAQRFPGLTLPEAIEANRKRLEPYPTLDPNTINKKWLSHVKALFRWLKKQHATPDLLGDDVSVDVGKGGAKTSRAPFTADDLKRLFGEQFAPDGKFETNQWALLIALFTGARSSSEVARIKLDDVHTEQGVLVFHLVEASKNAHSKRMVPVHRRLIDLGLQDYIDELRRRGETRLFPDWEPEDKVNRWFLRTYKKAVGIHDPAKVFHSFRHTLKTALARAGVNRDVSDLITGHKDQATANLYIHDKHVTMIEALRDGLNRVDFDAVDWKKLRQ